MNPRHPRLTAKLEQQAAKMRAKENRARRRAELDLAMARTQVEVLRALLKKADPYVVHGSCHPKDCLACQITRVLDELA